MVFVIKVFVYLVDLFHDGGDDQVHLPLLHFFDVGVGGEHGDPDLDLALEPGVLIFFFFLFSGHNA